MIGLGDCGSLYKPSYILRMCLINVSIVSDQVPGGGVERDMIETLLPSLSKVSRNWRWGISKSLAILTIQPSIVDLSADNRDAIAAG